MPDAVPRSAAVGVINKAGEPVDASGKVIGKVPDIKDPQALAGNTVTATGQVFSDAGDVLAKAPLDTEYTTEPAKGAAKSGGWNLFGKTKGAIQTVDNLRKPVGDTLEIADKLQSLSQSQRGRTTGNEGEAVPSSAKGEASGEKLSTGADTSRHDTSADPTEHTSVKESVGTPSSSAQAEHSPCIQLKDNDTPSKRKPVGKCCKSSAAAAQETPREPKTVGEDVKSAKPDVDGSAEETTLDEPMEMKSPVPIGQEDLEDAGSKPTPAGASIKQATHQATSDPSKPAEAKGPELTGQESRAGREDSCRARTLARARRQLPRTRR